ncbi:MAG: hypothetical protein JRH15_03690 [Deltaproteobacteria bacterium]|nr:hypothetical protein [Deltaproteobacteria bacterium]
MKERVTRAGAQIPPSPCESEASPPFHTTGKRDFSRAYRCYALGILALAYAFNAMDRYVLSILQEAIKHDFGLMDWQLGLLSGFAFAGRLSW